MIGKWIRRLVRPNRQSLLFEVTARCNLDCGYCYNVWKGPTPYSMEELPTQAALDVIRKAVRESRCSQFTFTGGEPTLRADLEDLVRAASALCRGVGLITNGTLLSKQRTRSLIEAGVSLFELPLNSADRDMHNRMAGGTECFDRVTAAAAEIRRQDAGLALVFVGTSENVDHWEEALQLGIALGAQGFLFNRYNGGGRHHDSPETLMPPVGQVRNALGIAERYAAQYGLGISASVPIPPCLIAPTDFPHVQLGSCPVGGDRAYWTIDPLGNVRPCNHSPTILGNVLESPFRRIKRSRKLVEFVNALPSSCSNCGSRGKCAGGCRAAAQVCYGSPSMCDPFVEVHKEEARQSLERDAGTTG